MFFIWIKCELFLLPGSFPDPFPFHEADPDSAKLYGPGSTKLDLTNADRSILAIFVSDLEWTDYKIFIKSRYVILNFWNFLTML